MGRKGFEVLKLKLRGAATNDYRELIRKLSREVKVAFRARERRLLVFSGSEPEVVAGLLSDTVRKYISRLRKLRKEEIRALHVFHDEFPDARLRAKLLKRVLGSIDGVKLEQAVYEVSHKFLGSTYDVLILDLTNDLKPNDVGRLLGIVSGGGLIALMTPPIDSWNDLNTIFRQNLTVPNHPEPRRVFIKYFIRKLMTHEAIYVFDTDSGKLIKDGSCGRKKCSRPYVVREVRFPKDSVFPEAIYKKALTQDQVQVIKLVEEHLVPKPKKKHVSLVIIADRGRGKSCAIGISLAGFIKEMLKHKNRVRIAVTAAEPLSIQSLMKLASEALNSIGYEHKEIVKNDYVIEIKGDRFSIEFWEPYTVLKLGVDMVVVDEAAGIPVPLLHKIWRKFRRTIYATTIHGYEGAGRGFQVRFLRRLEEDPRTNLVLYEMKEPIRYGPNDPIELFVFDALKLDAEPDELSEEDLEAIRRGDLEYVVYDPNYLFSEEGEKDLKPLFGIFVLAHYRNEPDDLGRIADAPHHSVRAAKIRGSGKIVGAVQLAEEGGLPDEVVSELLMGGRIPGNIIPDRLLKHWRLEPFGKGVGWRIVRIAVHIKVQGMGIGSFLLNKVVEEAVSRDYDWVGAGFGISEELLHFWVKNGFIPVHLSPDRNRVSGEYTSIVVKPLSPEWEGLVNTAVKEFSIKLLESLHSVYWDLEPEVIYALYRDALMNEEYSERFRLTEIQKERLMLYMEGLMTYESVADAVNTLIKASLIKGCLRTTEVKDAVVAIARTLQGRLWDSIFEEYGVGKGRAVSTLRKLVREVYINCFGSLEGLSELRTSSN